MTRDETFSNGEKSPERRVPSCFCGKILHYLVLTLLRFILRQLCDPRSCGCY